MVETKLKVSEAVRQPETTRVEQLVQDLTIKIITGGWQVKQRLPSERDLSESLSVSRPTLREALRQLERIGLLVSRQGSGTTVCNWQETATIDIFPAYLISCAGTEQFWPLLESSLRVRVAPLLEALRWLADDARKVNFLRLRQSLKEVWAWRDQPAQFVAADFEWLQSMIAVSEYYPALWVMNAFVGNYINIIRVAGVAAPAPADYMDVWTSILELCKSHQADEAVIAATEYFRRHDQALLSYLTPD